MGRSTAWQARAPSSSRHMGCANARRLQQVRHRVWGISVAACDRQWHTHTHTRISEHHNQPLALPPPPPLHVLTQKRVCQCMPLHVCICAGCVFVQVCVLCVWGCPYMCAHVQGSVCVRVAWNVCVCVCVCVCVPLHVHLCRCACVCGGVDS